MHVKAGGDATSEALRRDAVICLVELWLHDHHEADLQFISLINATFRCLVNKTKFRPWGRRRSEGGILLSTGSRTFGM
jgi:hypothetical protein